MHRRPSQPSEPSSRYRRERTKSSQSYVQQSYLRNPEDDDDDESDDTLSGEAGEEEEIAEDPFFQRYNLGASDDHVDEAGSASSEDDAVDVGGPLSPTSTRPRIRPDSTAEPLTSPLASPIASPRSPMTSADGGFMQEINLGVLGADGVGKSVFIQRAFDLRSPPLSATTARKMSIDGTVYLVRLVELAFDDVDIDDENRISWPETVDEMAMPPIDGVLALYDVMNKESLAPVPEILNSVVKATVPFLLVASKCDNHPSHRQIDPAGVEQRAKAFIGDITALQTSDSVPDSQKRCVAVLLRAIVSTRQVQSGNLSAAARRRANSQAVRPVSPRPSTAYKHNRANSEAVTSMFRTNQVPQAEDRPPIKSRSAQQLALMTDQSFLEESGYESYESDPVPDADRQSISDNPSLEKGYTFDQLVDRLLAQPLSKSDSKFVAVFLALYRYFVSPGQLLDAIIKRFDAAQYENDPPMIKNVAQQRYLNILEAWIGSYPGDFAHFSTRRKMSKFVDRLSEIRLYAVAAREMAADLAVVVEDDDTDWACCDRSRKHSNSALTPLSSTTTLIDPFEERSVTRFRSLTLDGSETPSALLTPSHSRAVSGCSSSSCQTMLNAVESAQRQAKELTPTPRHTLSKIQWRALMEQTDEQIARELTRIDWIMFSSIRPRDTVRHVSLNAEQKKQCRSLENVKRMIDHFNHLAHWVANFILLREKPKHRALMLEKFMRVARKLREMNNYNSLGAVLAGINSTSIHRLVQTRELIPHAVSKDFMKLEILMGTQKSHFAYRLAWENSSGERIPYFPLHSRDLVTASEGNKTFIGDTGRINWKKFDILGEVIVGLQRAQGVPYPSFPKNEEVKILLLDCKIIRDEDELYDRSVQLESNPGGANQRRFAGWFKGGLGSPFP